MELVWDQLGGLQDKLDAAMTLDFASWQRGSEQYANVDAGLSVKLTTLYFFCNRPTLGALMGIGEDISDALAGPDKTKAAESPAAEEQDAQATDPIDAKSSSEDSQGIPVTAQANECSQ